MRLSDKNIEAILSDSRECRAPGMGDVQLLCHEVQERRKGNENTPTVVVADLLIERLSENGPITDYQVLALVQALKTRGYLQTTTMVNTEALYQLLYALEQGTGSPSVRELQVTRNLPLEPGERPNPIDQLKGDYEEGRRHAPAPAN